MRRDQQPAVLGGRGKADRRDRHLSGEARGVRDLPDQSVAGRRGDQRVDEEWSMPDLMTTFKFTLEVDGVELATFRKCAGIESETEIIEYKEANKEGRMIIRKVPGAMSGGHHPGPPDRHVDRPVGVAQAGEDGDVDSARRNGSIVVRTHEGRGRPLELRRRLGLASGTAPSSTPAPTRSPPRR